MSLDTYIAIAGLALNALVACVTIYIAYLALVHTAKPRIEILLREPTNQPKDRLIVLHYDIKNIGHWYALPPAIDVVVYLNFDPLFDLIGIGYGSQQEIQAAEVRIGKGGFKYLKAMGIKLIASDLPETIILHTRTPTEAGTYHAHISAYSPNGVAYSKQIPINCT